MAAQTAIYSQHATLSGTTADSITFSYRGATELAVTNRDSSDIVYFTYNGATAVAAADETFVVLPLQTKVIKINGGNPGVVSVVGDGGGYSVEIW